MEKNLIDIERVCGLKPPDQEFVEIASDPNFVFLNDPNFTTLRLYDIEDNIINVNSWLECAHYVSGGWSVNPATNLSGDMLFLLIIVGIAISYTTIKLSIKRFLKNEN